MTIFILFFSLSWLQMLNLPALLQNKNTQIGPFPWKIPHCTELNAREMPRDSPRGRGWADLELTGTLPFHCCKDGNFNTIFDG